ncbi:MAG: undecaprenyldiphospho-muramoylpentapeptide beta-N-acetylglucosaminyltransferase [Kordiimonadaceae bacterium]|nr:undecaprenyldiphospho-muramoylpentapeptide beta-N-acetylglucosaminyltransferase [Kordiimonadaceae bacterium]MBO6569144.1 undecaprenyldiphospho-muramoylpentapeptide beta-N-acetylglucosaminyltransferase [Kordiimonadaceae bacterium]MBO6964620.1 undecaprenyldiphospho-muramoylpentapeptide beta-N-acetylglucosaminyltransferase [Kordiimonadaceae bacterium]
MTGAPYIILASGGTGGHMMPAEAVADKLISAGYDISLLTDKRGDAIGNVFQEIDRLVLKTSSHMGGGIVQKIKSGFSLIASTMAVRKHFRKKRPTLVVGFGGYPSLPAVLAARSMNIPYMLHEQNAVLGRVNRWMANKSQKVALSVQQTQQVPAGVETVVTGNPVRTLIANLANIAYAVPMGGGDIRVFVLGGSQGARILSDIVPNSLSKLDKEWTERLVVTHQARPEDLTRVREVYEAAGIRAEVKPYFDDVAGQLLKTQLVISRAGASTLAELTAMGRPAVLVPLAIAADDHQSANAAIVEEAGGAWVMNELNFTVENLSAHLLKLFDDMGDLRDASDQMRTLGRLDAADALAAEIIQLGDREGLAA